MVNKKTFTDSIDPSALEKIIKYDGYVDDLKKYIQEDQEKLSGSIKFKNQLSNNFNNNILKYLNEELNIADYRTNISKLGRLIFSKFSYMVSMLNDIENKIEKFKKNLVLEYKGVPYEKFWEEDAYEIFKNNVDDVEEIRSITIRNYIYSNELSSYISKIANEWFFIIENICKIYCGFTCYEFAVKLATHKIINHGDVHKTLKRLSKEKKEKVQCIVCKNKGNCKFKFDFKMLANIYAYSMRIRQLADYTEQMQHNTSLSNFVINRYSKLLIQLVTELDEQIWFVLQGFLVTPLELKDIVKFAEHL